MDLRMPISRVRSMTAVYMDWKMTRKPMMTAMPMTTSKADVEAGKAVGRDGGEILFGGGDVVGAHARCGEDGLADFVLVLRLVFGAEVEHGGFALGTGERAHGVDGDELAAAFAVLDDAADAEGVVEDADGVADLFAGGGSSRRG